MAPPSRATGKSVKKIKYAQKYKEDYHKEWPCIKRSSKDESHAFCTTCNSEVSVKYGGRNDILRHIDSDKHCSSATARSNTLGIADFFRKSGSDDSSIIKAETLFTGFIIEHNLNVASSDHAGPLFRRMLPDSASKLETCAKHLKHKQQYSLVIFQMYMSVHEYWFLCPQKSS